MISWGNKFQIVGTNPYHYISNFDRYFSTYIVGDEFQICKNNGFYITEKDTGEIVFDGKSDATLRQNIDTWISNNFVVRKGDVLIKTIDRCDFAQLIESSKYLIFQKSLDPKINLYRDTIKVKLAYIINPKILGNIELYSSNKLKNIEEEDIKKSIGKYEEILMNDKEFIKHMTLEIGEKND